MCRVVLNPITSVKRYSEVAPDAGHTCDSCAFSALQWAWACMLFFTLEDHEFQKDTSFGRTNRVYRIYMPMAENWQIWSYGSL